MKVRNLLLAGLAVAAMTACSNNDEIVDNGIQAPVEEASMRINLKFANETTTRANSTSIGEDFERTSKTVTAIIEYPNTNKKLVFKDLDLVGAEANGLYQTEAFSVEAGSNVKVYAIINHKQSYDAVAIDSKLDELKVGVHSLPQTGLAYIAGTVAEKNAFLMSGSTTTPVNIVAGKTDNVAPITVDRVAAKLDETTVLDTKFPISTNYNVTGGAISVKLLGYSYSNLSSDSYIFRNENVTSPTSWLQVYEPDATEAKDNTYRWITDPVTYCLENNTSSNVTKVHYKGQVYIGENAISADFFIRAVNFNGTTTYRLFTSWTALTDYYKDATISALDPTKTDILANYGIKRYAGGICYYEASISTTIAPTVSAHTVLRNNWYQLKVNKISKIGFPTPAPDTDGDPTMLTIQTTVNPWTIQVNGFDL